MPKKTNLDRLQDMQDGYKKICRIGVMDFSDYYDLRMDGVEENTLQQSKDLSDYVNQLLYFENEAVFGRLDDDEDELFTELKEMLRAEPQETGIHKMLQFKMMDALLKAEGNLESDPFQLALDCQTLYDSITSNRMRKTNEKKLAMQDDGSFNKSPRKIAGEILEKEKQQEEQPLQKICLAMLQSKKHDKYTDILNIPALVPYRMLLQEDMLKQQKAEEEKNMTPAQQEQRRLSQEIEKKRALQEKLKLELGKTSDAFNEEYEKIKKHGVNLTVPSKKKKGTKRFLHASEFRTQQQLEKDALDHTFRSTTDEFVRLVDAMKTTDKGPSSDEFRQMMESLTMLRNQQDTLRNVRNIKNSTNKSLTIDAVNQVYKDTLEYLKKRDQDGLFGRHFGQGGTRYRQAKQIMHLLEQYSMAAKDLDIHRKKNALLMRQERKEALRKDIASTEKEIRKLEAQLETNANQANLANAAEQKKSKGSRRRLENGMKDISKSLGQEKGTQDRGKSAAKTGSRSRSRSYHTKNSSKNVNGGPKSDNVL